MKKQFFAVILLICLLTASLALAGQNTLTIPVESINYEDAQSIADMLNADRTNGNTWILNSDGSRNEQGPLPALILDPDLTQMAMQRAAEQALCFGHTRPDGTLCFSVDRCVCAENVGAAGYNDPADMYQLLQETDADYSGQGHRRNMYAAKTSHVGIGSVTIDGYTYYAMVFAEKAPTTHYESTLKDGTATIAVTEELLESTRTTDCNVSQNSLTVKAGKTAEIPSVWVRKSIAGTFSGSVVVMLEQVDWVSADSTVAAVEGKLVRGVAGGTTSLTCNAEGKSLKVSVTVEECAHENATHRTSKEPTRTENGTVTYQCPDCGAEWEEMIPKLTDEEIVVPLDNEDTEDIEGSEDTESTQGTEKPEDHEAQEVAEPEEEGEGNEGPAGEECTHKNAKQVGFKEPTYTTTGSITYQCPDCGAEWEEELQKIGPKNCRHTLNIVELSRKEPTYTEAGSINFMCLDCGVEWVEEIPKLGQGVCTHPNMKHWVSKEPTCTAPGRMNYQCPDCGKEYDEYISILDHVPEILQTGSSCTTLRTREICKVCGKILSDKIEKGNGHQYTETVIQEADVYNYGKLLHHCDVCGHEYTSFFPYEGDLKPEKRDQIPYIDPFNPPELPQPSKEDGTVYEVDQKVCKHPRMGEKEKRIGSCNGGGSLYYICPDCGREEFQRYLTADEFQHDFYDEATYTYECGYTITRRTCRNCGFQDGVQVTGSGNHQWMEMKVIEAPTETKEGKGTRTCYHCQLTETVTIPKLDICKHEQTEIRTTRVATCCERGEQQKVCVACGSVLETYTTNTTDHVPNPDAISYEFSPTCENPGNIFAYCMNYENCHQEVFLEEIPRLEHRYEQQGNQMVCTWCGLSIPVACTHEHTHKEWIGGDGYGCGADQIFAEYCDDCLQQLRVWNEPAHACDYELIPERSQVPTCTEKGTYTYKCRDCGFIMFDYFSPTGHSWVTQADGTTVCSICGEIQTQE